MSDNLRPGVYIEEVDTGAKTIEGVATSTSGFIGVAERGPTEPTLLTSFNEYARRFGGYLTNRYLARAVEGFFQNGGKRCFVARVVSRDPLTPAVAASVTTAGGMMTITALGPGAWARHRLAFKVSEAGLQDPTLFKLTLMYWDPTVTLPASLADVVDPTDPASLTNPARREATILEVYDNLSADTLSSSFYERCINGASVLARVSQTAPGRPTPQPEPLPSPVPGTSPDPAPAPVFLTGGDDGAPLTLADFQGAFTIPAQSGPPPVLVQPGHGMRGLEEIDEIAILCSPDEHAVAGVAGELIDQCERLKDRFAILQATDTPGPLDTLRPPTTSKYGAFYFPWIRVLDPDTATPIWIPPGGHIAGVYARNDLERGVYASPANQIVRGLYADPGDPSSELQVQVTKAQQDVLNRRGVNALRYFPGRGSLVWGARTMTPDPDWKYVNVRRLFIFVEESIAKGIQWVVFEPNDERLWARVRQSVRNFLTRVWREGMLQGRTEDEAYFVRCDRTTMTQADVEAGRLIVLIGLAPVRQAEFVIFRIGQWTGGSEITES